MLRIKLSFLGLALLLALFFGCTSKSVCPEYKYFESLNRYLSTEMDIKVGELMQDEMTLFILQIDGCGSCVEKNLNMLNLLPSASKDRLLILLTGFNPDFDHQIEKLNTHQNIVFDRDNIILSYETGLAMPLVINYAQGGCRSFWEVKDIEIENTLSFLSNL
jgi:hypothetical protein